MVPLTWNIKHAAGEDQPGISFLSGRFLLEDR
jgi:hypothetical protein